MADKIDELNKQAQEEFQKAPAQILEMSEQDTATEFKVQRYLKYQKVADENYGTAVGKFDTLIISISGGGLYVVFESLKFYKEQLEEINFSNTLINFAGILFTVSIISNLISQWTSFNANKFAGKWAVQNIYFLKKNTEKYSKEDCNRYKNLRDRFNIGTSISNTSSALLLFAGIILLGLFSFFFQAPVKVP